MSFCTSCGTPIEPGDRFCPSCGAPARRQPASPAPLPAGGQSDSTAHSAAGAGLSDNGAGVLCYVFGFISGIIFLVLQPWSRNPTVRFHAFQSIFFNVAAIAIHMVATILGLLLALGLPMGAAGLMMLLYLVIWLGVVALWILLMVRAYSGKPFVLPLVGTWARRMAGSAS